MHVLINFKICDNSQDCGGIAVCPNKAFYWDDKKKTIAIDQKKCTSCGLCEKACPAHAIRVAKNKEEYLKIKKEIDKDSSKMSDLFVDRYGATPIASTFVIPQEKFDIQIVNYGKNSVAELFDDSSINCLLKSIPISDLFQNKDVKYGKIKLENDLLKKKYKINQLPALLFFKSGKLLGKIEGYFNILQKKELLGKINKIIS
jgi:NAD-dependent dihydropyrimidine dehydrogenase PreA subunit